MTDRPACTEDLQLSNPQPGFVTTSTTDNLVKVPKDVSSIDMTDSQRALELRKFFAPFYDAESSRGATELNTAISNDGSFDAFAETVLWRLGGVRTMISLIDRTTQYFLAGAERECRENPTDLSLKRDWFGCSNIPTPGGLCEHTLALDRAGHEYPCFMVENLQADRRFANLPVVDGSIASYRFYAGMPITTDHGINIGSMFMFDDKPRPEGLNLQERKFMFQTSCNVMKHLETKREAAERRRISLMSKGIAKFLEATSHITQTDLETPEALDASRTGQYTPTSIASIPLFENQNTFCKEASDEKVYDEAAKIASTDISDKIKLTLEHAANILRESLELTAGGVVLLDTALGNRDAAAPSSYFDISMSDSLESRQLLDSKDPLAPAGSTPGQFRSFHDQYEPAKILATSVSKPAQWQSSTKMPDGKTLQNLITRYPKGNIWYLDDKGYFSSIEQVDDLYGEQNIDASTIMGTKAPMDLERHREEADALSDIFKGARQIIFLPLWDAGENRWYSGCFLWSQSAVPVFTIDSEVAYVSAFTNSMMVGISRLEAITANKMKADFISSISHEFRSPLHGILASTEFLRDSELDSMQAEFISTIQNCGSTLLDTINHVLDYSKINSFEKKGRRAGSLSNELYQISNVALLCEEIVYGMMAAKEFQGGTESSSPKKVPSPRSDDLHNHVHIVLDFEHREWNYKIQTGALRRIIMNIFGNAQKFTETGFILVQLRVRETDSDQHILALKIIDSGRGMSTEYMERKLYTPFAQEDTFAPGIGLGLSIVWSIVNQLGGMIHIRSELGKGTDVEVTLPLEEGNTNTLYRPAMARSDTDGSTWLEAQQAFEAVRRMASGKRISILRNHDCQKNVQPYMELSWQCIESYFSTWFGFTIINPKDQDISGTADLIITEYDGLEPSPRLFSETAAGRLLLIREGMSYIPERKSMSRKRPTESIWCPIGPYKLARVVATLFRDESEIELSARRNRPFSSPLQTILLPPKSSANPPLAPTVGHADSAVHLPEIIETQQDRDPVIKKRMSIERAKYMSPLLTQISATTTTIDPDMSLTEQHIKSQILTFSTPETPQAIVSPKSLSPKSSYEPALHVLAVDDNIVNLQLLNRYLAKRPQDVVVAAKNGIEAIAAVRQATKAFDIIFMDLSMPDMDGFEATRLIRLFEKSLKHREAAEIEAHALKLGGYVETGGSVHAEGEVSFESEQYAQEAIGSRTKSAYIVALTGLASKRDRDEAEESGFNDFLTKPIGFAKIGELLARLSAEKTHEHALRQLG